MTSERWDRQYSSYRDFYEAVYNDSIIETRDVEGADASMFYARQGAGDWSDAATPDIVVSVQRTTSSSGLVDLGAGAFRLAPVQNRGIVVPMNMPTIVHVDQPHDILVLAIPYQKFKKLSPEALPDDGNFGPVHACEFNDPLIYAMMERLWLECDAGNINGALFAEGALTTLAATLLRLSNLPIEKAAMRGGLAPWQARRATEALRDLLAENVSLTSLADEVGLSPFHFSRAFKQSMGVPPHRYRTNLRLERACHLLATTDASVTDIAFQVGYESSQALARIFAQQVGTTPTKWRRERRR